MLRCRQGKPPDAWCIQAEPCGVGRGSQGLKGPGPGDAELYPVGAGKQKVTSLLYINPGAASICELSSQGSNINCSDEKNPQK